MVSFVDESHSDSLVPWKRNHRLLALSDNENVGETGSEVVVVGILDVDDLVRTWVVFNVHEGTDTTNIVSTLDKDSGTVSEFDDFVDFASLKVQLHRVVLVDFRVGVTDGSSVMGHNIRNFVLANALFLDLAEFESGFLGVDADRLETSLNVHQDAEVLVGLVDRDDVHEAKWEPWVSSDLVVNFDLTFSLSADLDRFHAV